MVSKDAVPFHGGTSGSNPSSSSGESETNHAAAGVAPDKSGLDPITIVIDVHPPSAPRNASNRLRRQCIKFCKRVGLVMLSVGGAEPRSQYPPLSILY